MKEFEGKVALVTGGGSGIGRATAIALADAGAASLSITEIPERCRYPRRGHPRPDCPYKGDCTYYTIPIGGTKSEYAVWTYEKPYQAMANIKTVAWPFIPHGSMQFEVVS